ncbi:MAG: SDR family NAD(P)-dependent oxidoreductase, partial [Thermoanaerobaculia bacterium]|nr:SDR family NAD(P)-dependent oxidoreductase [Thermoanaerobaculia bacterium]
MDLHLQNKVIIVTGGSRGIGEAITRALAAEGAIPVIATRPTEGADVLVSELQQTGIDALCVLGDLTEPGFCQKVVEATAAKYGRIHGLVNNAGVNDGAGLEHGSPEKFRGSLLKNLFHYYDLA